MPANRVRTIDVALAAVVATALVLLMASGFEGATAERSFDVLAAALIFTAGGALALHRRAPMVMLAVSTSAVALYGIREYPNGPAPLLVVGAIFAVSLTRGPAKAWAPAAFSTAVLIVTVIDTTDTAVVPPPLYASWTAGAVLLGASVRGRRAERAALEERARHLAETREEEARRRVVEERVRIARDLHDSIAHTLASISVQAGVGAHVLDEQPDDARDALVAIKDTSREALTELRATLGMLRSDQAPAREPTAGLDRLPSLLESTRAAGLPVDMVIEGDPRPLPSAVDTAAFRIVQESLTNVIRHAGPARATVTVCHGEDRLEIEVTDDGRGAVGGNGSGVSADSEAGNGDGGGAGGGHGLPGMRERVALLGGELHAGPHPSGGYRVQARLPL